MNASPDIPASGSRAEVEGLIRGVIGGPTTSELDAINIAVARAVAEGPLSPAALGSLLGGLVAIAAGPYGAASTSALHSLRNCRAALA